MYNFELELLEGPESDAQGYHFPWNFSTKTYGSESFKEEPSVSNLSQAEVEKTMKELELCPNYPLSFSTPKVTCLMIIVSILVALIGFFLMLLVGTWTLAFPVFIIMIVAGIYGSVLLSQPGLLCYMKRRRRALEGILARLNKSTFELHGAVITLSPEQSYLSIIWTSPAKSSPGMDINLLSRDKLGSRKMIINEGSQKVIEKTNKVVEAPSSQNGFFNIARNIGVFVKRKRKEYVNFPRYVKNGGEKLEFPLETPVRNTLSPEQKESTAIMTEGGIETNASNRASKLTEKKASHFRFKEEAQAEEEKAKDIENQNAPANEVPPENFYDLDFLQKRKQKRREYIDYTAFVKRGDHKVDIAAALLVNSLQPPSQDFQAQRKKMGTRLMTFEAERDEGEGEEQGQSLAVLPKRNPTMLSNLDIETSAVGKNRIEDASLHESIQSRLHK